MLILSAMRDFSIPIVLLAVLLALTACSGDQPATEPDAETTAPEAEISAASNLLPTAGPEACAADSGQLLHVASPDWSKQVIYMLMIDRFDDGDPTNNDQGYGEYDPSQPSHFSGGDFQGVIDRLDYLRSLGVTAVWVTPPLYNQWWSTPYQATGWHGYWPVHFQEVDPHYGTLDDYKRLSHELHCRGMYLIQDTIANHVGNFYAYEGEYDPDDTAAG
ncbi:MAG: hypothetical protein F4Z71_06505, partial [Gammaproteobacteria bacterium]|nr:hypothetical protein [Gammaproteobacteria bacterium]